MKPSLKQNDKVAVDDRLKKIFHQWIPEYFQEPEFKEFFKKEHADSVTYEDLVKQNIKAYNPYVNGNDEWERILAIIKKNEIDLGLQTYQFDIQNISERKKTIKSYLSPKASFLFFNVGSFHKEIYEDEEILALLDQRLREKNFGFLFTASDAIMKDEKGNNKFAQKLLDHPEKGLLVNIGERVNLHFISVLYNTTDGMRWKFSFETDHCEFQAVRKRISPFSVKTRLGLMAYYCRKIIPRGKIVSLMSEFDKFQY
jgi:hypothetical protein